MLQAAVINHLIHQALAPRDQRSRKVVVDRYGLGDGKRKTLAQLGAEYHLTRERVRQIEEAALRAIRAEIKNHEAAIALLRLIENYLNNVGKLRRGDLLSRDFNFLLKADEEEQLFYNKLHFLARVFEYPEIGGGNDEWHIVWYNDPVSYETAQKLAAYLLAHKEHNFHRFLERASLRFNLPDLLIINYLAASKRFAVGPYGDLGADHWLHVNPRTVRDKAYLVLQRAGQPLHFREIARLVNELDERQRSPATVHNELIKDPRFVLVKRGFYSLND
jgi:hypothetical protein